jgi:hypothetical protein
LELLRNKCEFILTDELALILQDSEEKLKSLLDPYKFNREQIKPSIDKDLKTNKEIKEIKEETKEIKSENQERKSAKTPVKEISKEQEKDELAEIFKELSATRRPSWSETRVDYSPLCYTSNLIKNDPKADIDLLD